MFFQRINRAHGQYVDDRGRPLVEIACGATGLIVADYGFRCAGGAKHGPQAQRATSQKTNVTKQGRFGGWRCAVVGGIALVVIVALLVDEIRSRS